MKKQTVLVLGSGAREHALAISVAAVDNARCHVCEVRSCCPLQPVGRQVPQ